MLGANILKNSEKAEIAVLYVGAAGESFRKYLKFIEDDSHASLRTLAPTDSIAIAKAQARIALVCSLKSDLEDFVKKNMV